MARTRYSEEKRDSRISLLVTKSFYEQVTLLAISQGLTTNDFIIKQLEKTVEKNSAVIENFQTALDTAQSEFVAAD